MESYSTSGFEELSSFIKKNHPSNILALFENEEGIRVQGASTTPNLQISKFYPPTEKPIPSTQDSLFRDEMMFPSSGLEKEIQSLIQVDLEEIESKAKSFSKDVCRELDLWGEVGMSSDAIISFLNQIESNPRYDDSVLK